MCVDSLDKGTKRGEDRVLRVNGPFLGTHVINDACGSMMKPVCSDLPLGPHPFRFCNPPHNHSRNVHDASYAACSLSLHDRDRIRCHSRELIQLAADGDYFLSGEEGHDVQEVNPEFEERSSLTNCR